ncbi:MAG: lipid-binding SYLF domain-containing protein [Gammaproteobacteria bacterium]|nr:lipid-binding SYLF domain-containing protein [Gammaproteobacteria bacterium]
MMHETRTRLRWLVLAFAALAATAAKAQPAPERELAEATELIQAFMANDEDAIPVELLQRARGIAVIPNVFRGGFILGGRRGRGVLTVRMENGSWSNPTFVTLTGGSIGWQIGAESTDLVLVFANENAVKNMSTGKFTLGGDATAVAGPLGRHASLAVTFRAEVYGYLRSRGLFAGAAFEGARLNVDDELARMLYTADAGTVPLGPQTAATPASARRFLLAIEQAASLPTGRPVNGIGNAPANAPSEEARTFPLPD